MNVHSYQGAFRVRHQSWLNGTQTYYVDECIKVLNNTAKSRSIAIPVDLESQVAALFTKSQLLAKTSKQWLTLGKDVRGFRSQFGSLAIFTLFMK